MPRGGKRDGAGRKTGATTEKTREVANMAVTQGITPLEYMLRVLRDENAAPDARAWAAEKAAPYVHPKLAAIEHRGEVGLVHSLSELTDDQLAAIATGRSSGVVAAPKGSRQPS